MRYDQTHQITYNVSEGEERRRKGQKNILIENNLKFPNLMKNMNLHIQEVQ